MSHLTRGRRVVLINCSKYHDKRNFGTRWCILQRRDDTEYSIILVLHIQSASVELWNSNYKQRRKSSACKGTCHVYQITGTCALVPLALGSCPASHARISKTTATLAGKEAGTQYYHHKSCTCKSTWSIGERRVKNHWGRWFESWTQFSRMYYLKK